jgi:DNA-binding NtrC family response regulator
LSFEHAAPIVLVASPDWLTRAEPLTRELEATHSGTAILVPPDELSALLTRQPQVAGVVLLGAHELAVAAQRTGRPVVLISPSPPTSKVDGWFPDTPAAEVIKAFFDVRALASGAPIGHRPRRKSDTIVGNSPAINALLHTCSRLAPSAMTVLVTGETGAGKELVARALHYSGPRSARPFVAINCAAIPEGMVEAELFGHARGAFTGAATARAGAFEAAEGGTLFLDEIGELPLTIQPKLLRVLDSGEITRLGTNTPIATSARVVLATNRDLELEAREGRFREDLYYRVGVHTVCVPPLRDRPDDIPLIVKHQLSIIAERERTPVPRLTAAAVAKLYSYSWPGNVRELIGTIERIVLSGGQVIDAEDIVLSKAARGVSGGGAIVPYREAKAEFERVYFERLMRATGGNVTLASTLAKKTRKEIYDGLKRTGLREQ